LTKEQEKLLNFYKDDDHREERSLCLWINSL